MKANHLEAGRFVAASFDSPVDHHQFARLIAS
jgi:hypothetical protein